MHDEDGRTAATHSPHAAGTIMNVTRGTPIARYGNVADTFWDRARGLIGRPALPVDHAPVLSPRIAVHTLFLTVPIDVLHLDAEGRVLMTLQLLHPWRIGPIIWRSRMVVELPAGTVALTATVVGDIIAWREPTNASPRGQSCDHPRLLWSHQTPPLVANRYEG